MLEHASIIPTCPTPDHSALVLDVDTSEFGLIEVNKTHISKTCSEEQDGLLGIKYKVNDLPPDFMNDENVMNKVLQFIRDSNSTESSQDGIDEMYDEFLNIYYDEMNKKLPTMNTISKPFRSRKPFWNETISSMFKQAHDAQRAFTRCKGDKKEVNRKRDDFKEKQHAFDKEFRQAKRAHLRNKRSMT